MRNRSYFHVGVCRLRFSIDIRNRSINCIIINLNSFQRFVFFQLYFDGKFSFLIGFYISKNRIFVIISTWIPPEISPTDILFFDFVIYCRIAQRNTGKHCCFSFQFNGLSVFVFVFYWVKSDFKFRTFVFLNIKIRVT